MGQAGGVTNAVRDDLRWAVAIRDVLSGARPSAVVAQPIVGLEDGVVAGYELLSRFPDDPGHGPQDWFLAAARVGLAGRLNAHAVRLAVARRDDLPPNTFLSLNVAPDVLADPEVRAAFEEPPDLVRIVVELTEHVPLGVSTEVLDAIGRLRDRGAKLAVDDTGAGYANLQALLLLRPDLVKIDRDLVTGCGTDPVRRAVVQALGEVAGRLDAWAVAEGIEGEADVRALAAMGVALGQGYLLGRPAPPWPGLSPDVRELLARGPRRADDPTALRGLMLTPERVDAVAPAGPGLICRPDGRPEAVVVRGADGSLARLPAMTVSPDSAMLDVVVRALARPERHRYAPLVCTDERGHAVGVVAFDDLVTHLHTRVSAAELAVAPAPAPPASPGLPGQLPPRHEQRAGQPDPVPDPMSHVPGGQPMKRFRCGDVVPGCTAQFHGTEEDILGQVAEHARSVHGMTEIPDELVAQVRSRMVTA